MSAITIRGARTHNLQSIDLVLPRNQLIVITGPSGSGKSSLAFETLYAEGQRRYVESLSAYARQFLSVMEKPDVDQIDGLSPAIAIEQKSASHNPRSTVATVTEIYDYLRLLFARAGIPRCPTHGHPLEAQTVTQMLDQVLEKPLNTSFVLLAPLIRSRKGEYTHLFTQLQNKGFVRVRIDGTLYDIEAVPLLEKRKKHTIEVVIDRLKVRPDLRTRLASSFETALSEGQGLAKILWENAEETLFSATYACPLCGYNLPELEPRLFSFNSPLGACASCDGLGSKIFFDPKRIVHMPEVGLGSGAIRGWDRRNPYYFHVLHSLAKHYHFDLETPYRKLPKSIQNILLYGSGQESILFSYPQSNGRIRKQRHVFEGVIPSLERRYRDTSSPAIREELSRFLANQTCPDCHGTRLGTEARHVFVQDKAISDITAYSVSDARCFFQKITLQGHRKIIATTILKEVLQRLQFLENVGLGYLTLERRAETLSGGEAQRIRLASQIGAGLVGVLYILDEPSIGLHQRDNARLIQTLKHLRDLGNTVIVVEHDEETILSSDHIVDLGPGAGIHGGKVVAEGTPLDIQKVPLSLTGQYLSRKRTLPLPLKRKAPDPHKTITLHHASGHNLKDITVSFPIGLLTCVTGVSGSGKSTLINDTLYPVASHQLNRAALSKEVAPHRAVSGLEHLDQVVWIDQSPIGRTPRSNAATYTGLFAPIRELFAMTPEARTRGYSVGRFSFNVPGGRCETCEGGGLLKVEMHFLADLYVPCDTCRGKRYREDTLQITYKNKTIHDVLEMTVEDACVFFQAIPLIYRKLQTLQSVGLGYLKIGQSATTLSGGEAQRIKLAKELSRKDTGNTLYLLDEPTTGLHFHDVQQLMSVLLRLRDHGNTIIIIEHHLDVIKMADWIIDLGPEGGAQGGKVVASGPPETIIQVPTSHTGHFLAPLLSESRMVHSPS